MRELPVEHDAQALRAEQHITNAKVTVDKRARAVSHRRCNDHAVMTEPTKCQLERRMRFERDRTKHLIVALKLIRGRRHAGSRRRQFGQTVRGRNDAMDLRRKRAELGRQCGACRCIRLFAKQALWQRLAVDAADEERLARPQRLIAEKQRFGSGDALGERHLHESIFEQARQRFRGPAHVALPDQRQRLKCAVTAIERDIERPRLARCATRKPAQSGDANVPRCRLACDERRYVRGMVLVRHRMSRDGMSPTLTAVNRRFPPKPLTGC